MATIYDIDVNQPSALPQTSGILQPALTHRFRVRFNTSFNYEEQLLSAQVISCGRNHVSKTLIVMLEQDIATDTISKFLERRLTPIEQLDPRLILRVDCMCGDDSVAFTDHYYGCKLIYHKFDLDYTTSDAAVHELIFQFDTTEHERGPASR